MLIVCIILQHDHIYIYKVLRIPHGIREAVRALENDEW
jgi:hypothetical protein